VSADAVADAVRTGGAFTLFHSATAMMVDLFVAATTRSMPIGSWPGHPASAPLTW
jgi:type IV secretory pathway protease TraF